MQMCHVPPVRSWAAAAVATFALARPAAAAAATPVAAATTANIRHTLPTKPLPAAAACAVCAAFRISYLSLLVGIRDRHADERVCAVVC